MLTQNAKMLGPMVDNIWIQMDFKILRLKHNTIKHKAFNILHTTACDLIAFIHLFILPVQREQRVEILKIFD